MADYFKAVFQKLGAYTGPCISDITPAQRHQLRTRGADAAALVEPLAAARLTCFRVVDTSPGQKRVLRQQLIAERLRKAGTPQGSSSSVEMLVQFMEPCPGDGQGFKRFYCKAPERIDMMRLAASQVINACSEKWQPAAHSEPSGCLCSGSCQPALPEHGLQDQEAPVLILLEALHKAGRKKGRGNTPHRKDDDSSVGLLYCIQNCIRRELYSHGLLRFDHLFEMGLAALPCYAAPSFYKCLLMGLAKGTLPRVLPGRPAKEYKALLASSLATPLQDMGLAALGDDADNGGSGSDDIVMAEGLAPAAKQRRHLHYVAHSMVWSMALQPNSFCNAVVCTCPCNYEIYKVVAVLTGMLCLGGAHLVCIFVGYPRQRRRARAHDALDWGEVGLQGLDLDPLCDAGLGSGSDDGIAGAGPAVRLTMPRPRPKPRLKPKQTAVPSTSSSSPESSGGSGGSCDGVVQGGAALEQAAGPCARGSAGLSELVPGQSAYSQTGLRGLLPPIEGCFMTLESKWHTRWRVKYPAGPPNQKAKSFYK